MLAITRLGISIIGYPFVPTIITVISLNMGRNYHWIFSSIIILMKLVVGPILMLAYVIVDVENHSLGVGALIMTMLSFVQAEIGVLFYNML
jgi:hypothetical protein